MATEEKHDKQFRGCWIPSEVIKLFEKGSINSSEVMLLITIDSLVSEDKGCFASNEYLGKKVGMSAGHVKDTIKHLVDLGLVLKTLIDNNQRHLETSWSRIKVEVVKDDRLKSSLMNGGGGRIFPQGGADFSAGEGRKNCPQSTQGSKQEEKGMSSPSTNGHSNGHGGFKLPGEEPKAKTHWFEMAELLCRHLLEKRQLMREPNLEKWAESFRLFIVNGLIEKARFDTVLKWYVKHIGEEFIPRARSADTFCEKFIQIEDQMKMREGEPAPEYSEAKPKLTDKKMTDEEFKAYMEKIT